MASAEHLSRLLKSVSVWNEWRRANLGVRLDLSSADLTNQDIRNADLTDTLLCNARFLDTRLDGARFDGACLNGAIFCSTDLTHVTGLNELERTNRVSADLETLLKSTGSLPESFVRLLGIPDEYLEHFLNLLRQKNQYRSCFISYSNEDQPFAEYLHYRLLNIGVSNWFAPSKLRVGEPFATAIIKAIAEHDHFLVVMSPHAFSSTWVGMEVNCAMQDLRSSAQNFILPVVIDQTTAQLSKSAPGWANDIYQKTHIEDFNSWQVSEVFERRFSQMINVMLKTQTPEQGI
jgi:hypothetical protein